MDWLPHGEKISKISLFVLAQLTNVTDGRTDGQTPGDGNSRAMHSIARQKWACLLASTIISLSHDSSENLRYRDIEQKNEEHET